MTVRPQSLYCGGGGGLTRCYTLDLIRLLQFWATDLGFPDDITQWDLERKKEKKKKKNAARIVDRAISIRIILTHKASLG